MAFGRKIETKEEKAFWDKAYKVGMKNSFCNGNYERENGNFIVEEDRLNKNSVIVIDRFYELADYFEHGNWCLGNSIIFKNLCFIQQDNGGDEWLTMKLFKDKVVRIFESISFGRMLEDEDLQFKKFVNELMKARMVLTEREFVKRDKNGEIIRDDEGLAITETKKTKMIIYGEEEEEGELIID